MLDGRGHLLRSGHCLKLSPEPHSVYSLVAKYHLSFNLRSSKIILIFLVRTCEDGGQVAAAHHLAAQDQLRPSCHTLLHYPNILD
jgi:hypothetical protein